jgi:hypothetical protein
MTGRTERSEGDEGMPGQPCTTSEMLPTPPRYDEASLCNVLPGVVSVLAGVSHTGTRHLGAQQFVGEHLVAPHLGAVGEADPLLLAPALAGVRRVAVLLVDGLGYHLLPAAARCAPVLADVLAGTLGSLTNLTSGFPSTTPVSLASLCTGVPPGTHGILGFTVNVPGTDRVLNHVNWATDPDPLRWQPVPTQFERARDAGVAVTVVSRPEFVGSGLTVATYRGADYRASTQVETLVARMLEALRAEAPCLVFGYEPALDHAGHESGVDSPAWRDAAAQVGRLLGMLVDGLPTDAALLVTADHGQLDVPTERRFDIDSDPRLSADVRLVAGEPRARHLHTRPGAALDVLTTWREMLGDAAWVVSRREAVAAGWFGPVPPTHLGRIGDVVVACRSTCAVLATAHESSRVAALIGYHGSHTPMETAVPLVVVRGGAAAR